MEKLQLFALFAAIVAVVLIAGMASNSAQPKVQESQTLAAEINQTALTQKEVDSMPAKSGNPIVVFETSKGTIRAEIFLKEAPITGANFMSLVNSGFYNGLTFHRVEPNFVVQGGDPKGDGTGGSSKTIPLEIKPNLKHVLGSLGMARSQDPNSASSQFYIVIGPASFLDGQYAVFGKVLTDSDLAVAKSLKIGDKMTKVYEQK
jgi:peptidyl-prolyl cis-trans isomerase B (cyclophilin B)